jgi:glycosyltransferase involved in cell wall biosynthesis
MNELTPLVSVIIPCYNQSKFLLEAIESVKNSYYKNTEIIIVDDGSTNEDLHSLLRSIQEKDVRIIWQRNFGVSVARNSGIKASRGEYIVSLDYDDILAPTYISNSIKVFNRFKDISIVGCNYTYINEEGKPIEGKEINGSGRNYDEGRVTSKIMVHNYMTNNFMFRKDLVRQIGGFSDELSRLALEDWDFLMRAYRLGCKIYIEPEVGLFYRQHGESRNGNRKKRLYAKLIILKHHFMWFIFHPIHMLAFLVYSKFGFLLRRISDIEKI